jgi:hypothetical protein
MAVIRAYLTQVSHANRFVCQTNWQAWREGVSFFLLGLVLAVQMRYL